MKHAMKLLYLLKVWSHLKIQLIQGVRFLYYLRGIQSALTCFQIQEHEPRPGKGRVDEVKNPQLLELQKHMFNNINILQDTRAWLSVV